MVLLSVSLLTLSASADVAPPTAPATPADAADAGHLFATGEEAYRRGEHARAAEFFERAHAAAAHPDAAWNAAQAWLHAGGPDDDARGATWLSVYLDEAPEDASDRAAAERALRELGPGLARVDLEGTTAFERVHVDGRAVPRATAWVRPGQHRIEATAGSTRVQKQVSVEAGERLSVTLAAPRPAVTPKAATPSVPPPVPAPSEPERGGVSPLAVVIGGTVTVGLGATSLGFGLATENARDAYGSSPTQAALDDGREKQDLTNAFFWGAVASGLVTVALAAFVVDWRKPVFSF